MSRIQFTGLASGLDTDSIVKAMLTTQQSKIDKANQDKTLLQWKKEAWSSVNDKINSFYSNYVNKLRLESTFESYSATTSSMAVSVNSKGSMPVGIHKIEVTQLASELSKSGDIADEVTSKTKTFQEMNLLGKDEVVTFNVNDKEIEISANDTLTSLENKIKEADESLNVNFDVKNKKLFISSKETGKKANVNIDATGDTTGLLEKIGISGSNGVTGPTNIINETGNGAKYKYNGIELEADTNDIEVNGLSLTLKEVTTIKNPDGTESSYPVIIEVKNDPDKIIDFMSEFIDEYNKLLDDLNKMYSASSTKSEPLTDAEKEAMTDKQIEQYEQNIKDSLLRRDSGLKTVIDTLRNTMQGVVKGNTFGSLSAIGITTGEYSEKGKLHLDKDKLRAALEKDQNAVKELFVGTGKKDVVDEDGKTIQQVDTKSMGLATRLNTSFQDLAKRVEGVKSYQSYYNDKIEENKIRTVTERISELQEKYTKMEKIYYKKFTAMEKNLAMLNSQTSNISSWFQ